MDKLQQPNNLQAERAVIGACLLSSTGISKLSEILVPEDFYDANNKIAYGICVEMFFKNKPVDLVTFAEEAERRGVLENLGGQPFLSEIIEQSTVTANVAYYAELVKKASLRRKMIEAGEKITSLGWNKEKDPEALIDEAEKIILNASNKKSNSGAESLREITPRVLESINDLRTGKTKHTGYLSNLLDLDKYIPGFRQGTLNIIAARPSMGKTALALNIAQFGGNKNENKPILFFSLEMSSEELVNRMLSAQSLESGTGVKLSSIITGEMNDYEFYTLQRSEEAIREKNIFIYNVSELTAVEFMTISRRFKTRYPDLGLIVVDYLQLMSAGSKRNENRQNEVAEISRTMKAIAVELQCPVIALSQLSRAPEKRNENKPQLSDLRDSGAIEQDADTVLLLYREDYYGENENNNLTYSTAELRIAKNRNGTTGMCKLVFQREYTRFVNYGGE